jgi:hypothetical protein
MRERTLKESHSSSRFSFRAKFQISTCPNLNRRLSLDGGPVCMCVCHFKVYDSSHATHSHSRAHLEFASTTIRSSSSVPPGRRGRAPASTRTKGSPARCRRIDPRAGFDRCRNHSRVNSSRIEFGSIGRVERDGADETALVSAIRRTRSDPAKEGPIRRDPMATRGSRERKPPAKVRRVDRSRANERERG